MLAWMLTNLEERRPIFHEEIEVVMQNQPSQFVVI